jgi:glucose/mannose transport system substrate-binding protein
LPGGPTTDTTFRRNIIAKKSEGGSSMAPNWSRRQFIQRAGTVAGLATLGVGAADLIAACGGSNQPAQTTSSLLNGAGSGDFEIFSWWTGPGEKDGKDDLFNLYKQKYPKVTIQDSVSSGGAGSTAKAVLTSRMNANNPPDTFQVHAGQELIAQWVAAKKMEPVTSIWNDLGLDKVMPKDLKDIVTANGEVWSIPVDVHRGNCVWYLTSVMGSQSKPNTFNEFVTLLDHFKGGGMQYPLALGTLGNWQQLMWFENGILANGGADYYKSLFTGKGSFTDSKVTETLNQMKTLLGYANPNTSNMDWSDACGLMVKGQAAVTIMGDWAKGYFTSLSPAMVPNKDFGVFLHPDTKGKYVIISDTFGVPKGAKHTGNGAAWVQLAGTNQGQAAFNPKKGSIPARTDVSKNGFDAISQSFMDEFGKDTLVGSVAHGSASPPNFVSAAQDALGVFITDKDVNKAAQTLESKAKQFLS